MDRLRGQRNKNRECLVIVLFVISVAVQIYFFYSGAVGEVFEKSIGGKDGMIILGGLAKYLQLIGGIAAAYASRFPCVSNRHNSHITFICFVLLFFLLFRLQFCYFFINLGYDRTALLLHIIQCFCLILLS